MTLIDVGKLAAGLSTAHVALAIPLAIWRERICFVDWPKVCPQDLVKCPAKVAHFTSDTAHVLTFLSGLWATIGGAILVWWLLVSR